MDILIYVRDLLRVIDKTEGVFGAHWLVMRVVYGYLTWIGYSIHDQINKQLI